MRIDCPSCSASFEVKAEALGAQGRNVRCAQCKTTWFAAAPAPEAPEIIAPEALEALVDKAEGLVPEIQETPEAPVIDADVVSEIPTPIISADDRADHEALGEGPAVLVAALEGKPLDEAEQNIAPADLPPARPRRKTVHRPAQQPQRSGMRMPRAAVLCIVLVATLVLGVMGRNSVVRAAPETASIYAAIGFPVNLRGLDFQNVVVRQETQDGVQVLMIEGEVENVAGRAIELPRVRLAVIGADGNEIYSWTTLLPRSILYPRERVPFKSRLASPPPAGKQIMVRFLTRGDLVAGLR